ncbi:hypothetical protein PAXINDRAFT_13201 [Paxillus involutus ATCC 200175]|uniref:Uncharacterized protein n=1 Tax=Paxillus involutus ATCC 200175 TaxID=664439 RepID=A0A0C9U3K2_PAXIN|nr:hypothetical protein PAXINDRAFT_13201 [Paxillus involutus ATCC 200175]
MSNMDHGLWRAKNPNDLFLTARTGARNFNSCKRGARCPGICAAEQAYRAYRVPLPNVDALSIIFSSAPRLRYVKWYSIDDPGPVAVNGYQLHFLHLTVIHTPATRVLDVLAACPNLLEVLIRFYGAHEYIPMPPRGRILLPELRSLVLDGNWDLTGVLRRIQARLLAHLNMHWRYFNGREDGLEALSSLLACSPHLEEIAPGRFLETEEGLISMITTNKNLATLTIVSEPYRIPHPSERRELYAATAREPGVPERS